MKEHDDDDLSTWEEELYYEEPSFKQLLLARIYKYLRLHELKTKYTQLKCAFGGHKLRQRRVFEKLINERSVLWFSCDCGAETKSTFENGEPTPILPFGVCVLNQLRIESEVFKLIPKKPWDTFIVL